MPVTVSKQKTIWNNVLSRIEKTLKDDLHTYQIFYATLKLIDMDDENIKILYNKSKDEVNFIKNYADYTKGRQFVLTHGQEI